MAAKLDIEAAQAELGFGRYQLMHLVLCLLPILFNGIYISNYVFAAADVEYRCLVPECESQPPQYCPGEWNQWALLEGKDSRCHRYAPVISETFTAESEVTVNTPITPETINTESEITARPENPADSNTISVLKQLRAGSSRSRDLDSIFDSELCNGLQQSRDNSVNTRSEFISDSQISIGSEVTAGICSPKHFTNVTERCNSWIYSSNDSIVAEFDLACEDWKRTLVGTVHSAGVFAALTFIGLLSDRFGRLAVFVGTATCPAIAGLARALCRSYPAYVALEFVESLVGSGVYTAGFVLVMETTTDEYRVLTSNLVPISFSLGLVVLAGAAWVLPGWRILLMSVYVPSGLFLTYCLLLDESPRWLAARGRTRQAAAILLRAAKINKVTFSPKLMCQLLEQPQVKDNDSASASPTKTKNKPSIAKQVIRSRLLMCRLAMCAFWWISCTLVFYGLSINSVSLLGNKYLNFMLTALAEIPGYVISVLALDRFGRRRSITCAFLFCGVPLISVALVPSDQSSVQLALTLLGKVGISMAFGSLYIFTSEMFPTQARHSMLATCSMIGRIGQILAPQTPLLILVWRPFPYVVFGVASLLSALLMLLAPETRHSALPDTVAQCEQAHQALTAQAREEH